MSASGGGGRGGVTGLGERNVLLRSIEVDIDLLHGRTPRQSYEPTDAYGCRVSDWDFGLPHSKCSCDACAAWRSKNWQRLNPEWKP